MTDIDESATKAFYANLMEFRPFSVEPSDETIEQLSICAEQMKDTGDNLSNATSVLTQAIIVAGRSVSAQNGKPAGFRYGSECRLAENEISTEISIAWQIARMLLRGGLVKKGQSND